MIGLNEIYAINYYGIIVVFRVCGYGHKNSIYLVELATKKYKDGISLTANLNTSKKPLVINAKEKYLKAYPTDDDRIPIHIGINSEIFWEAMNYVEYPKTGYVFADRLKNYTRIYWDKPKKILKEKTILC